MSRYRGSLYEFEQSLVCMLIGLKSEIVNSDKYVNYHTYWMTIHICDFRNDMCNWKVRVFGLMNSFDQFLLMLKIVSFLTKVQFNLFTSCDNIPTTLAILFDGLVVLSIRSLQTDSCVIKGSLRSLQRVSRVARLRSLMPA